MKVLIDPGHRNNLYDYGAIGNGQKESVLALQFSKKLKAEIEKHNIICYLSRENEDTIISVSSRPKKAAILKCDLLISVHINSATSSGANGIEVLYKTKKQLATDICNAMCKSTGAINRGAKLRTDLGVLNGFNESILLECGFISNAAECKKLADAIYQDKLVKAIADVIVKEYKITVEEDIEMVRKIKMQVNGTIKEVNSIEKNGENYVRVRDLADSHIKVDYDTAKKLPIIEAR